MHVHTLTNISVITAGIVRCIYVVHTIIPNLVVAACLSFTLFLNSHFTQVNIGTTIN